MRDMGIIQGSKAQAVPLIVAVDTVYVHTDIKKLETDAEGNPTDNLYEYHEIQYNKDEYIALLSGQNEQQEEEITGLQLVVVELFEVITEGVA